jgi:hypothetical protein
MVTISFKEKSLEEQSSQASRTSITEVEKIVIQIGFMKPSLKRHVTATATINSR